MAKRSSLAATFSVRAIVSAIHWFIGVGFWISTDFI